MRAVVQRVASARVEVDGEIVGAIDRGLLVYLGFGRGDTDEDRAWVLGKTVGLRVFEDEHGKMGRSVTEIGGAVLLVSQFTLYGDLRRGRRPSFDDAMPPEEAERAYDAAVRETRAAGVRVETGRFRADMKVWSMNDGPVTIWLDSAARTSPRSG
ncbi:MAG TPA: D-aminoacyl-tRNA deacylase [Polyangiaceae bacterium]|jgi:D-tyrosyl-tRNA(Tyr) deacylase|nr:D-aminoacyl-tRNA deacylase [Polyangiaceae bacterium]